MQKYYRYKLIDQRNFGKEFLDLTKEHFNEVEPSYSKNQTLHYYDNTFVIAIFYKDKIIGYTGSVLSLCNYDVSVIVLITHATFIKKKYRSYMCIKSLLAYTYDYFKKNYAVNLHTISIDVKAVKLTKLFNLLGYNITELMFTKS